MTKTILLVGASGFIGGSLKHFFQQKDYRLFYLVRHSPKSKAEFFWDYEKRSCDLPDNTPIDIVINLAGETIIGRWSESKKKRILFSRIESTRYLTELFTTRPHPPKLYLQASAAGYYGNRGDEYLSESSSAGRGFLSKVCEEWEACVNQTMAAQTRCIFMRFGMVLDPNGGALKKLLPAYKLGLGGTLGDGEQYMSWISLHDVLSAIYFTIINEDFKGPVNFVAEPVKNQEFSKALATVLHRPHFLKIPAPLIKLIMGEASSLFLDSQRVIPDKLQKHSFIFKYPTIYSAFEYFFSKSIDNN